MDAAGVGPGDDQLGGHDRPDAGLVEQRRGESRDVVEDLALEIVSFLGGGQDAACELRSTSPVASSSTVAGAERRKRLQRWISCPRQPRSSSRSGSGAVTITRVVAQCSRRTSTALRRASSRTRSASRRSPARGSVSVSAASAVRAALTASSGSLLPRSRRSLAEASADLEHRFALLIEIAGKAAP